MSSHSLLFAKWISLGFGSGKAPFAPGTFGTLVGIPFFILMSELNTLWYLVLVSVFFVIGIWACQVYSEHLGVHDHGSIVWDEVVGYLITMTAVPFDWLWILLGFILFRIFDIWKPWPIKYLDEKVHGGLGIMIDDVLAGVFAAISLWLIRITVG